MTTMVERVARAICIKNDYEPDGDYMGVPAWTLFVDSARAAIEAMREPNDRMIGAYVSCIRGSARGRETANKDVRGMHAGKARVRWSAMIDAALAEESDNANSQGVGGEE